MAALFFESYSPEINIKHHRKNVQIKQLQAIIIKLMIIRIIIMIFIMRMMIMIGFSQQRKRIIIGKTYTSTKNNHRKRLNFAIVLTKS